MSSKASRQQRESPWVRRFGSAVLILFFAIIPGMMVLGEWVKVPIIVGFHLIGGWFLSLKENLLRISADAATWVPGVLAFLIAAGVGHGFLQRWAKRREKRWSPGSTLALAMIVPVLFVISFLVPGIILQTKELSQTKWVKRSASTDYIIQRNLVQDLYNEVIDAAVDQDMEKGLFPDSLAELEIFKRGDRKFLVRGVLQAGPAELPMYFGGGFSLDSDPTLPLLISQPFTGRHGMSRWVATLKGVEEIQDKDTEAWIQRALDARAGAEKAR